MSLIESAGVSIDVREHSRAVPGNPHVILVHGYPDQQDMWLPVVSALEPERFHLVTYDVRGAGGSGTPSSRDGYRTELLVEDLVAVVESTVPDGEPFHLVGHDWGSVQLWDVVAAEKKDARISGRIASYTSISGPSLDHVAYLSRHRKGRGVRMLKQGAHSWYVYAFHLPVIPELLWRSGVLARLAGADHFGDQLTRDGVNGLNLYRANFFRRMRHPGKLSTDVPVQVVHPTRDPFVTEVMLDDLDVACSQVTIVKIDAGHWVPRTRTREIAKLIGGHVTRHAT